MWTSSRSLADVSNLKVRRPSVSGEPEHVEIKAGESGIKLSIPRLPVNAGWLRTDAITDGQIWISGSEGDLATGRRKGTDLHIHVIQTLS